MRVAESGDGTTKGLPPMETYANVKLFSNGEILVTVRELISGDRVFAVRAITAADAVTCVKMCGVKCAYVHTIAATLPHGQRSEAVAVEIAEALGDLHTSDPAFAPPARR